MGREIVFAPQALEDLAEIVRYIANDDPEVAERIGHALISRVLILKDFPELGPLYPKTPSIRTLVNRPYIIFYRVRADQQKIDILRYWHATRGEVKLE
jgi:addiction module RelE/StbE family toxin